MSIKLIIRSAVVMGVLALIAWLPAMATEAEKQPTQIMAQSMSSPLAHASAQGMNETASGAVEDTLTACLSRIPKDASAGQRMIAEESCARDKADRRSIDAVPGA